MFGLFRRWRRRKVIARPTPPEWIAWLEARAPFFAAYSGEERQRFLDLLKVFVDEKVFLGAGGLGVTDEMRVVISAAAVRIALHVGLDGYDRLTEIVVYPYDYRHPDKDGVVYGEAHRWGTVVLSWPAVVAGLANPRDQRDTAMHEFAHVLDVADGAFDGTPELHARGDYAPWGEVMGEHFEALRRRTNRRGGKKVLRSYGATNEAEFFAVATEAYFEAPDVLKRKAPELFEELRRFYEPSSESK